MGLTDVFAGEEKVSLKVSEIYDLFGKTAQAMAQNKIMLSGYKNHIDHDTVLILLNEKESETNAGHYENGQKS